MALIAVAKSCSSKGHVMAKDRGLRSRLLRSGLSFNGRVREVFDEDCEVNRLQ